VAQGLPHTTPLGAAVTEDVLEFFNDEELERQLRDQLVCRHYEWARAIAHTSANRLPIEHREDAVAHAMEAFVRVVERWIAGGSLGKLRALAVRRVRGAVMDYYRGLGLRPLAHSVSLTPVSDEELPLELADPHALDEEAMHTRLLADQILRQLDAPHAELLLRKHVVGSSFTSLQAAMHLSRRSARSLLREAEQAARAAAGREPVSMEEGAKEDADDP
jgi:DNA-directed RNA polymerase specialized sigma24 family protein